MTSTERGQRLAQRMSEAEHVHLAAVMTAVLEEVRRTRAAQTLHSVETGRLNLPPETDRIARGRW